MTIFHLPDLGEGLAEAIIHEWLIKPGDEIKSGSPMVTVETAKAVVEIPAPYSGKVLKLFAKPKDTIKTHAPLIEIETETPTATVAGKLETSDIVLEEEDFDKAHEKKTTEDWKSQAETLSGIRLAMAKNMQRAHQEVAAAAIFEEADISHWTDKTDITVSIISAVCKALKKSPALNAWYDGKSQKRLCHEAIHLGLAVETSQGLIVPVIKDADKASSNTLRNTINTFKTDKNLSPQLFQGATFTLSNIGNFAGLFATPIILPPTVAILATGRIDKERGKLPLSLSFDHRAVTGGEAAKFLAELVKTIALKGNSQ